MAEKGYQRIEEDVVERQPGVVVKQPKTYGATSNSEVIVGGPTRNSAWMPAPRVPFGCPPGLEYLSAVDQLIVQQQIEILEAFTGYESNNKYRICNSLGQKVYFAAEDTDCCTRQCCGPIRPFEMKVFDNLQREVMHISRPLRCQCCCSPCCLQEMEIQSPPGTVLGYVKQAWTWWKVKLEIQDMNHRTMLVINGPCCPCSCGSDVGFLIHSLDGTNEIGMITKQWGGLAREMFTDSETFGVRFPLDLDVKCKALLLAACFLVDFMFFEHSNG